MSKFIETRFPAGTSSAFDLAAHILMDDPHPQYLLKRDVSDGNIDWAPHNADPNANTAAFNKHNLDPDANPAAIKKHNDDPNAHSVAINNHNNNVDAHKALFDKKANVDHRHGIEDLDGVAAEDHTHPELAPTILIYTSYIDPKLGYSIPGILLPKLTRETVEKEITLTYINAASGVFTIAAATGDTIMNSKRGLKTSDVSERINTIRLLGIQYPDADNNDAFTWVLVGGVNTWEEVDVSDTTNFDEFTFTN